MTGDMPFFPPVGGGDGAVFTPVVTKVSGGVNIEWKNNGGLENPQPVMIEDGKTPVKGIDYGTSEDKSSIVRDVINDMDKWNGGVF